MSKCSFRTSACDAKLYIKKITHITHSGNKFSDYLMPIKFKVHHFKIHFLRQLPAVIKWCNNCSVAILYTFHSMTSYHMAEKRGPGGWQNDSLGAIRRGPMSHTVYRQQKPKHRKRCVYNRGAPIHLTITPLSVLLSCSVYTPTSLLWIVAKYCPSEIVRPVRATHAGTFHFLINLFASFRNTICYLIYALYQ